MAQSATKEILSKALKRRAEIAEEAAALDEVIKICRALLRKGFRDDDSSAEQLDLYEGRSSRAAHAAYLSELLDVTRRILIAEKRPLKRGELIKRLEAQGYEILGSDKSKVFGTNLWRSGKFVTLGGRGYWPCDVNLPGIVPPDSDTRRSE